MSALNFLTSLLGNHSASSAVNRGGFAFGTMPIIPVGFGSGFGQSSSVQVMQFDSVSLREVRQGQKEDKEERRATIAAVSGGIATVVLSGLSAFFLRSCNEDRANLQEARDFRESLNCDIPGASSLNAIEFNFRGQLKPIADAQIKILETKAARSRNIVILKAAAVANAVSAFVGGMMAIQWLITASIIAAVALAAITAFTVVWHCTDKTEISREMNRQAQELMIQIQNISHNMGVPSTVPSQFNASAPEGQ